ncbi:hypothetical protein CSIM01_13864 [Colletotrichum simmondsii]|uniref:BZIP domain-containing protein n=1 Tax=Colletotrichum simmondsii TaxID=703756 RepID=A0A135S916_9PEZI|nr:hypothetical protein CSIM01_13864 [Colletotrichum simmondsii]
MPSSDESCLPDMVDITAMSMFVPLYPAPPGQISLVSPGNDPQYQQWIGWNDRVAEPTYDEQEASNFSCPSHFEFDDQSLESSHFGTGATHAIATWASQANTWPAFQHENLQQPLPSLENTSIVKGSSCSDAQLLPESNPRADTSSRQMTTIRTSTNTESCTTSQAWQQGHDSTRIGAGGIPSPSRSNSHYERTMAIETNGEDKDEGEEPGDQSNSSRPGPKKGYRVKNRAAANRSREKIKQFEQELVAKEQELATQRMYLGVCLTALKGELLSLKNQILQHSDCDCEMIQLYIARAAGRYSAGFTQTHDEMNLPI